MVTAAVATRVRCRQLVCLSPTAALPMSHREQAWAAKYTRLRNQHYFTAYSMGSRHISPKCRVVQQPATTHVRHTGYNTSEPERTTDDLLLSHSPHTPLILRTLRPRTCDMSSALTLAEQSHRQHLSTPYHKSYTVHRLVYPRLHSNCTSGDTVSGRHCSTGAAVERTMWQHRSTLHACAQHCATDAVYRLLLRIACAHH